MALTKITSNLIGSNAIGAANITDASITAADLHATLDLTGKTVTVATASAGDNDTSVASTAFVTTAINNIVDGAPANLNTLNEIAASMNDDATLNTTLVNLIAAKSPIAGPTFTGDVTIPSKIIHDGDTDNYFRFSDTDTQIFVTGNSTRMQITNSLIRLNQENNNQDFAVYSSNSDNMLYVDASADAVGIGTASIDSNIKLQIEDSAYPLIAIDRSSLSADGNHLGYINFQSNGDVYARIGAWVEDLSETDGELRFSTQKGTSLADQMVITSDGYVGIGETAPTNLLHVKVSDAGINPHSSAQLVLERSGTNYLQFLTAADGTSGILFGDTNDYDTGKIVYDHNIPAMQFVIENQERMRIGSAGQIGIGGANYGSDGQVLTSTGASTAPAWETPSSFNADGAQTFNESGAAVDFRIEGDTEQNLFFVDGSADKIGIGTSSPAAPLDVVSNSSAVGIELRGRSADDIGQLTFESNDSGSTYSQFQSLSTEFKVKTIANIPMSFHTNNTERMKLNTNGYVDFVGASDIRVTFGSTGTAGNNDASWIRGRSGDIMYNSASTDHIWEIGGDEHMRLDSAASASVPQLLIKDAHPWIDMVAPDGSTFKSGITMRGGSSSTQAQGHFHLTRDSGYRTLSTAGNYDTYIDTTTANTAYGHFLLGVNNTEVMHAHADTEQVTFPKNTVFNVGKNNGYVQDNNWWIPDYVSRNVGSDYSTSTGRFTAPEAGTYYFNASLFTHDSGSSASQVSWKFYKNTSAVKEFVQHKTGAYHTRVNGSLIIELDVGDYVRIYVAASGTSSGWAGTQHETNNWCGFLIG